MHIPTKEEVKASLWKKIPYLQRDGTESSNSLYRRCISTSMGVCNKCCDALAGEVSLKIEDVRTTYKKRE